MVIELSNIIFTDQDDVVPSSGVEQILNRGVANTLAGNDVIVGTGGEYGIFNSGTLNTADGNDVITGVHNRPEENPFSGSGIYNIGSIYTDGGNDIITGNNGVAVGIVNYGTFNTGEGDDVITGEGNFYGIITYPGSIFDTGDGNDKIRGKGYGGPTIAIFNGSATFNTGDGNDTMEGSSISNFDTINTGNDDDIIISTGVIYYLDGTIKSDLGIFNGGIIDTSDGNDSIISKEIFNNGGNVFLGEGNDLIAADTNLSDRALKNFNFIGTGDGNDTITSSDVIYNEGVINTGNGDDSIIIDGGVNGTGGEYGIYNNGGAIITGNGNDSIIANEGFESGPNSSGAWFLGEGDDYIKGYGSGDFYGGNGNDILELTPGTYTVGIWGEEGESPIFTKGNQLMITSEFEKLKVGSTIYDFTSLTAGQIIIVA